MTPQKNTAMYISMFLLLELLRNKHVSDEILLCGLGKDTQAELLQERAAFLMFSSTFSTKQQ